MSMDRTTYVIYGCDLTGYETDKLNYDWNFTEDGENFTCYKRKGEIQLFTDNKTYTYLGYILAVMEEYGTNSDVKWTNSDAKYHDFDICSKSIDLQNMGIIKPDSPQEYKFIAFDEYN